MNFEKTNLRKVYIKKLKKFSDSRGKVVETYLSKNFSKFKINFIQDIFSISKKNVLRGMHGDNKTWKLVSLVSGSAYFIVANNDKKSDQYKKWISFNFSSSNCYQILIPPKFAVGYLALSSEIVVNYKQTTYYGDFKQFTIKYNDSNFKFKWPNKKFILSKRDM